MTEEKAVEKGGWDVAVSGWSGIILHACLGCLLASPWQPCHVTTLILVVAESRMTNHVDCVTLAKLGKA